MKTCVAIVSKKGWDWCLAEANPTMYNVESLCKKLSQQYGDENEEDVDIEVYEIERNKSNSGINDIRDFGDLVYSWEYGFTEYGVKVLKDDIGYHIVEKVDGDE